VAPLAQLHAEGKVSVLPAVGYTDPNESHFTSRHFWEVGATDANLLTEWMGRYLDLVGTPDNPLQGLSLDDSLQPSLATARVPVATIERSPAYEFYARGVGGVPLELMYDSFDALGQVGVSSGDLGMAQSGAAALSANTLRRQLAPYQPTAGAPLPSLPAGYPVSSDALPARMSGVAQLLAAGMPLRCVSVSIESVFDTHNDQASRLTAGLGGGGADRVCIPARPGSPGPRRPCVDARVVGVRPSPPVERIRRHRPRRGGLQVRDRHAGGGEDDRRVARPGARFERGRQRAGDLGLQGALLLAAGAVAGAGSGAPCNNAIVLGPRTSRLADRLRRSQLRRVAYGWRHRGLTPADVMLASYPRSGKQLGEVDAR
jgi:hypothetical protein